MAGSGTGVTATSDLTVTVFGGFIESFQDKETDATLLESPVTMESITRSTTTGVGLVNPLVAPPYVVMTSELPLNSVHEKLAFGLVPPTPIVSQKLV